MRSAGWVLLLLLTSACSGRSEEQTADQSTTETRTAAEIYAAECAICHEDSANTRALDKTQLARLNPAQIAFALSNGAMQSQGEALGSGGIFDMVTYLAGERDPYVPAADTFCADATINPQPRIAQWGLDTSSTNMVPAGNSVLTAANAAALELAWVFGLPDVANARSQPVVTHDTLVVAATSGHLFALDRFTGCIKWHQPTPAPPRTALTLGEVNHQPAIFYGDVETHVNAVALVDGTALWRTDVTLNEHSWLTGAPVQAANHLVVPISLYEVGLAVDPDYECCRSHGGVVTLNADNGEVRWQFHTTPPAKPTGHTQHGTPSWGPSGAPIWSTPTVDSKRNLIYVGTGQNASLPATDTSDAVIALQLDTGKLAWKYQTLAGDAYNIACDQNPPGPNCPKWRGPDHDIGAAIILTTAGEGTDTLLAGQKSGDIYRLDPASGEVIWQSRAGAGSALGGVHWGMAVAGEQLFVPVADPPYPLPGYRPEPGLYAFDINTGNRIWKQAVERGCETNLFEYFARKTLYPECSFFFGLSAQPQAVNDVVLAGALDGKLRVFAQSDGRILTTLQTAREFATVNNVAAHGGAIDAAGPLAVGRFVYVQSGYAQFGQLPGNALVAYRLRQ